MTTLIFKLRNGWTKKDNLKFTINMLNN